MATLTSPQTGSVYIVAYRNPENGDSVSYREIGPSTYRVRVQITDPARLPAKEIPLWGSPKGGDHLSREANGLGQFAQAIAQGAVIVTRQAAAFVDTEDAVDEDEEYGNTDATPDPTFDPGL